MKKLFGFFFFLMFFTISFGQPGNNDQVPVASLNGKILDSDNTPLPGATILVAGTKFGTSTNESGDYFLSRLPVGKINVQVSFVGFRTKNVEVEIHPGKNLLDITLEFEAVNLDVVSVSAQKREQQVIDVPITMSVLSKQFIRDNYLTQPDKLSEFVPGLLIRMQGSDRPGYVIRGLSSDEVSAAAQPRISVFYNNVPVNRTSGAAIALFDLQQVDVLKGPQGTLFGRGAAIGAVHYLSQMPVGNFEGYLEAGTGNFKHKELEGAVNIPVKNNKLLIRTAGTYKYTDGYIKNTFGGTLNGENSFAGRFSATYFPSAKNKIDLVMNFQKDNNPGLGFMSMNYPNTNGSKDPFDFTASQEQGEKLKNKRSLFDASLYWRHYFNPGNFFTVTNSYRTVSVYNRWDGDGTAATALDMRESTYADQLFHESRFNYSLENRLNGSIGLSYWTEQAEQVYGILTNEQHLAHLFLNTGYLVTPGGQPVPMTNLPQDPRLGPLAGLPLVTDHQEENKSNAVNQALESWIDANFQITDKLTLTGGIRLINEWFDLENSARMSGGSPATLGFLTNNYPDVLFRESAENSIAESTNTITYRSGLKYRFNENTGIFAGFSKGHRPKVLQFTSTGEKQILDAETVNSYDLGLKTALKQKAWMDLGIFYYDYLNFQTSSWVADPLTGEFNYIVKDGGKAFAFGAEASFKYAIVNGLQFFGNYAYIHTEFTGKDVDGMTQGYAKNRFKLTPEHSFALGLNGRKEINSKLTLFAIPSFSFKTRFYFEDANTAGLGQGSYGLLYFRGGLELTALKMTISFWGNNLSDRKYIVSAGNAGSLFGDPTQIPGSPRMAGVNVNWQF